LALNFSGHSVLSNVEKHGFANASRLSESINSSDRKVTKKQALELLKNGTIFQIDPCQQSDCMNLDQGGIITIAGSDLPKFLIYHMAIRYSKSVVLSH
jgi:hypothetical protein